jgi:hypothetical protein
MGTSPKRIEGNGNQMNNNTLDTNNNKNTARPANQTPTARSRTASDSGKLNGSQRNVIRMMLATASTVAVIISAQAMATLDRTTTTTTQITTTASNAVASVPTAVASVTPIPTTNAKTSAVVVQTSSSQPRPATRSSR